MIANEILDGTGRESHGKLKTLFNEISEEEGYPIRNQRIKERLLFRYPLLKEEIGLHTLHIYYTNATQ
jgi:hypothetical protein